MSHRRSWTWPLSQMCHIGIKVIREQLYLKATFAWDWSLGVARVSAISWVLGCDFFLYSVHTFCFVYFTFCTFNILWQRCWVLCSAWWLLGFGLCWVSRCNLFYNMYNICILYDPFNMLSALTSSFLLCYSFWFAYRELHVSLQNTKCRVGICFCFIYISNIVLCSFCIIHI